MALQPVATTPSSEISFARLARPRKAHTAPAGLVAARVVRPEHRSQLKVCICASLRQSQASMAAATCPTRTSLGNPRQTGFVFTARSGVT